MLIIFQQGFQMSDTWICSSLQVMQLNSSVGGFLLYYIFLHLLKFQTLCRSETFHFRFLETEYYITQGDLKLARELTLALKSWFSCLHIQLLWLKALVPPPRWWGNFIDLNINLSRVRENSWDQNHLDLCSEFQNSQVYTMKSQMKETKSQWYFIASKRIIKSTITLYWFKWFKDDWKWYYEFTLDLHKVTVMMEAINKNDKRHLWEDRNRIRKTSTEDIVKEELIVQEKIKDRKSYEGKQCEKSDNSRNQISHSSMKCANYKAHCNQRQRYPRMEIPFEAKQCQNMFFKSQLSVHKTTHICEKFYECIHYGKGFSMKFPPHSPSTSLGKKAYKLKFTFIYIKIMNLCT